MAARQLRQAPNSSGLYDVLNLILDKGMVIDAYVRVSLVGIELLTIDARVVIASVDTFIRYAEAMDRMGMGLDDRSQGKGIPDLMNDSIADRATSRTIARGKDRMRELVGGNGEGDPRSGAVGRGVRNAAKAAGAAALVAAGDRVARKWGDERRPEQEEPDGFEDAADDGHGAHASESSLGRGIRKVAHAAAKAVGGGRTEERRPPGEYEEHEDDDAFEQAHSEAESPDEMEGQQAAVSEHRSGPRQGGPDTDERRSSDEQRAVENSGEVMASDADEQHSSAPASAEKRPRGRNRKRG